MKKRYLPIILVLGFPLLAHAQTDSSTGGIRGKLVDSSIRQSLSAATVSVLNAADSVVVASKASDKDGAFAIGRIPFGQYILKVSYTGYETQYQSFTLGTDSALLNTGDIFMQTQANMLQGVVVKTSPIVIKKDTVEYNASMFGTKPNATAEDVLKKLPGVEVDKDGNIKAQGETVQRILVNGKRFFGDDPKLATKNLPQDVIDKIQVFDDQSDQSKFTGFDDGNRVKTINITTKKNLQKGYFGKVVAGIGNKDLYDEAGTISRFNGDQQVTVIGQFNNTNKQNFTAQDILGSSSQGRGGGGGGLLQSLNNNGNGGLTKTLAGGLNFHDVWGKQTDFTGSYFYNNMQLTREQLINTENFYPGDTSIFNDQDLISASRNINQRVNTALETKFDSLNSMVIRVNGSYQQSFYQSDITTNTLKGLTNSISNSDAHVNSTNEGYNGSADILFRHRFLKKGRTFSLSLNLGGNSNNGNGNNYSVNNYFENDSTSIINQQYNSKREGSSIGTTLSYTEPVGKHSMIELNYNYSYSKNQSDRFTYNFDSTAKEYIIPDSLLTNTYNDSYQSNRVSLNYRIQKENFNISFGSGVQFGTQTSENTSKHILIKQQYTNLYPSANLNYKFSKSTNLRFFYNGRTAQPSVGQLQPVADNSDPLNIRLGNPSLKQSFTNSGRLLFTSFNSSNMHNIFASINAGFIQNNIVNATTTILSTGVDTIRPVNMNGAYNLSASFNYGFPLKNPKSNLNFGTNFFDNRSVGLITTLDSATAKDPLTKRNITTNYGFSESIRFTTNLKENFDVNFTATPAYNIARYSVQPLQNANYFSLLLSTEATYFTKSGWILSSDFGYTYYGGRSLGYNTSVPLLNAAIAKQLFKNKQGEIRLTVYDLLNQNVSITRNITENYAQDVQTKLLTRYALLTFTYNLKNFKAPEKKQQQNFMPPMQGDNRGRPPGM